MTTNAKAHRRSLKECFKHILQRRWGDHGVDHMTEKPSIWKRRDPSIALLPTFSSLTTLPDFRSSRFDIDQYSVSDPDPGFCDRFPQNSCLDDYSQHITVPNAEGKLLLGQRATRHPPSHQIESAKPCRLYSIEHDWHPTGVPRALPDDLDIGPERSLLPEANSFPRITPNTVHFQSPLSQLARACSVPSIYRHGASLQASLATLRSPMQSASTLRLQRSTQDLNHRRALGPAPRSKRDTSLSPTPGFGPVPNTGTEHISQTSLHKKAFLPQCTSLSSSRPAPPQQASELEAGLSSINHFSSFCVLDAASAGCPVTATSEDLRSVFEIGEHFCDSTTGVDGTSMETVTGLDEDGNSRIHLVMYSQLVNPNSGRSRFVLASLLDITSFITDAASLPDLERISEESMVEEELKTPTRSQVNQLQGSDLFSSNLLGRCSSPSRDMHIPTLAQKDDIWLDIASEESRRSRPVKSAPGTSRSSSSARSSTRSMDDVLDQFLASLQEIYADFFLLGKSPLDEHSYEICNVSPRVHASHEYVDGHLTKTSSEDRSHLEKQLTLERSFQMKVRWGAVGKLKRLYCIPLFGRNNITWVCFLVEDTRWTSLPSWK